MKEKMTAGDFCNRFVTVAERRMSVDRAAQFMREHHVGSLVVTDTIGAGKLVVGILTDRDIVTSVVAKGVDPKKLTVEDVMSRDVVTSLESDTLMDVLSNMRRKGIRRVPIVSLQGTLQGLITLDDMIEILAEQMQSLVMAINSEQIRERSMKT
ncbi:MAG: CBS domain-containing protein [Burkholderiales bacterium]|jgi:CBS domain-containing protein